jgi:hypothetical protein
MTVEEAAVNATTNLGIALLAVATFLFNPFALCVGGTEKAASSSHPCCPKKHAPAANPCATADCVCLNFEGTEIILPATEEGSRLVGIPEDQVVVVSSVPRFETDEPTPAVIVREFRFLTLCQLLI